MTTLELAEEIAMAVWLCCGDAAMSKSQQRAAIEAVIRVLHENHSWFCRNPTGEDWHEEREQRYEQVELFK